MPNTPTNGVGVSWLHLSFIRSPVPKQKTLIFLKWLKKQKSLRQMSFVVVVDCLLPGKDVY